MGRSTRRIGNSHRVSTSHDGDHGEWVGRHNRGGHILLERNGHVRHGPTPPRHSSGAVSGKTLRRKEYSCEWNKGQNPNVIKNHKLYHASGTTSCPSVSLVYQVKHTSRVQQKIQLHPTRSRHWMIKKRRKHRDIDCRICQNG